MDPLSAGASVVTFLGLAFSVTKVVHDALSAIKDGPQDIRYLSEEFAQLRNILDRLSHISMSPTDAAELDGLAKQCNDDVAGFETRLRRLDTSGADGRRGRLWRRLKLCFTEKDLEQMRHVVRGHVQLLTIRLNLIQVQQSSFSATQSTEILSLVQKLRDDVASLRQVNFSAQTTSKDSALPRAIELGATETAPCANLSLGDSIARLMRLLEKKPCVVESDDAEELVDDLERLLESVQKETAARSASEPTLDQFSRNGPQDDVSRELKLVTSLILSAPSMKLNQSPLSFLRTMPQGTVIHQERKRKIIDIGDGVVRLTTTKRQPTRPLQSEDFPDRRTGHGREFAAKLVFKPRNTATMLTVSVNQGQVIFGSYTSMLPHITVNNILPQDSPVFAVAARGSIHELVALVAAGNASLHDHDTSGQSLLHHSAENPSICKFLIEQGLDLNELSELKETPLFSARVVPETVQALLTAGADPTIEGGDETPRKSFISCACTPFNHSRELVFRQMCASPFVRYADPGTLELDPFWVCCSMLFQMGSRGMGQLFRNIKFLLSQGYNMQDKSIDGWNCLSQAFYVARNQEYLEVYKDILVYLVNSGADVRSTDTEGRCVSNFAYNQVLCTTCSELQSPYLGDLWDSVLDECGFDILEFRKPCPRKARYTDTYTRPVFEQIWKGREHRCPYWDDAPWPESSLEDVQGTWVFLDSSGQICEKCQDCYESYIEQEGPLCGECGFCTSVLGCQCAKDGPGRLRASCLCPLQRKVGWDKENNRHFFEENASHDNESSDGAASDTEVWSISTPQDEIFENPWERD